MGTLCSFGELFALAELETQYQYNINAGFIVFPMFLSMLKDIVQFIILMNRKALLSLSFPADLSFSQLYKLK